MALLDIIGPIMVGPSSSHTAGAVKLGRLARAMWNEEIKKVDIYLRAVLPLPTGDMARIRL